jgi:methylmalonyl-CoA/ethylmalonyl-CoA epimerase
LSSSFHHIGLACRRIEDDAGVLEAMGYASEGPAVTDPVQKVRVQFFSGPGPRIELIEPAEATSPVSGLLKRGTKFYHLAYEVDGFEQSVEGFKDKGFHPVGPAAPAAAFGMRRIVFLMSRTGVLIELIEAAA